MPILRQTSATTVPVSAWRRAKTMAAANRLGFGEFALFHKRLFDCLKYQKSPEFFTLEWSSLLGGGHDKYVSEGTTSGNTYPTNTGMV